jgi:putative ABC transport system ATP-binding protein
MSYTDGDSVRQVLEGFDMQASPAEVIVLLGPSGSGKSTLLNLLAGVLRPGSGSIGMTLDGGNVEFGDLTVAELTRLRRRHIGYVFQFFNLVPTLTVGENVLLPLSLNDRLDLREEAFERLRSLGLEDRVDAFPDTLSGGERQRTAIARALAHRPQLVLADEPTGNLDSANAARVVDLLISEVRMIPATLVMATHNEQLTERADQVIRLDL